MPRKRLSRSTDVELAILRVLWDRGPGSVRYMHNHTLVKNRDTGHSTTLKMMQVMFDNGLLRRDESRRPQPCEPAAPEAQAHIVDDLLQKVFGGSAQKLVMRAVQLENVTPEELAEIRRLLKQIEGDRP